MDTDIGGMGNIEKLLKDAKEISEGLKSGENSGGLFSQMAQITDLMDIIKSFRSIGDVGEPASSPSLAPSSDKAPNNIKALLAMAPYMGETNRRNIIIASKLMELMHFMNNFEHEEEFSEQPPMVMDNRNMLLAARPYVDLDKRDMVDLMITVMDISEILGKIERVNKFGAKL